MRGHIAAWIAIGIAVTALMAISDYSGSRVRNSLGPKGYQSSSGIAGAQVVIVSTDAHLPQGWRRTTDGWQHTSDWWASGKSINTLIEEQQAREPQWIQRTLERLRRTPPLTFAMMQLTVIAAVVVLTAKSAVTKG